MFESFTVDQNRNAGSMAAMAANFLLLAIYCATNGRSLGLQQNHHVRIVGLSSQEPLPEMDIWHTRSASNEEIRRIGIATGLYYITTSGFRIWGFLHTPPGLFVARKTQCDFHYRSAHFAACIAVVWIIRGVSEQEIFIYIIPFVWQVRASGRIFEAWVTKHSYQRDKWNEYHALIWTFSVTRLHLRDREHWTELACKTTYFGDIDECDWIPNSPSVASKCRSQ